MHQQMRGANCLNRQAHQLPLFRKKQACYQQITKAAAATAAAAAGSPVSAASPVIIILHAPTIIIVDITNRWWCCCCWGSRGLHALLLHARHLLLLLLPGLRNGRSCHACWQPALLLLLLLLWPLLLLWLAAVCRGSWCRPRQ
jgi:hypothetical protein